MEDKCGARDDAAAAAGPAACAASAPECPGELSNERVDDKHEAWHLHFQVASFKLLPITVRTHGGAAWFGPQDRRDVGQILKKYVRYRIERVWSGTAQQRKQICDELKGRRKGRSTLVLRARFRPLAGPYSLLQPTLTAEPVADVHGRLQRFTATPNELVVYVKEKHEP